VLRRPQLKISWELKTNSDGAIKRNGFHGSDVSHLGDIPSEAHMRLDKKKETAQRSARQRLQLDVSAEKVPCVRRA
jgi:hypothetical protein